MCDPLTIGGLALSAGSMVMQQQAQSQVNKARRGAMEAERIRQQGFQRETDALNAASQDRYKDFQGEQADKANTLGQYFTDQNQGLPDGQDPQGAPVETMPGSSNNIVTQEQTKQKAKAKAFGDQQGEALGELRSFGDLLGGIGRLQARDAAQIGTVGNFMRGSSSVLPYELEEANSKGSGMADFGTILGGLGSVGISAGLSGAGKNLFGTAAKTAASAPSSSVYVPGTITSKPLPSLSLYGGGR
jgi:hypothetical protein